MDILKGFFLVNTGVLSAITLYFKFTSGIQTNATNVSIATALLVFAVIFVYHIYMHISVVIKTILQEFSEQTVIYTSASHTHNCKANLVYMCIATATNW